MMRYIIIDPTDCDIMTLSTIINRIARDVQTSLCFFQLADGRLIIGFTNVQGTFEEMAAQASTLYST